MNDFLCLYNLMQPFVYSGCILKHDHIGLCVFFTGFTEQKKYVM